MSTVIVSLDRNPASVSRESKFKASSVCAELDKKSIGSEVMDEDLTKLLTRKRPDLSVEESCCLGSEQAKKTIGSASWLNKAR
jgi:hypothetical protein